MTRLGFLPALALAACIESPPSPATSTAAAPIVGGTVDTGDPAVVLLDLGGGLCTGTVISPHVVLTAGHCIDGGTVNVRFENQYGSGGPVISSIEEITHPSADLGLIAMSEASPTAPIPANIAGLEGRVGAAVRIVGFGVTSENGSDSGLKRQGTASLDSLLGGGEMATTNDPQGTCYGDSGGPNFMTIDGIEVVAGVTSRGTDICGAGLDIAVRADSFRTWIDAFVAEHDAPVCGGDGTCVPGCVPADPDCACAADGACTAACPDLGSDPDCDGCAGGDACRTDCPAPDPDCEAPGDPDAGAGPGGDGDGGADPGADDGYVDGGCAAGGGGGASLVVALLALAGLRRRKRS